MKIKFESTLDYQQDAISAITDIFKGQEVCESNFTVFSPEYIAKQKTLDFKALGYGNLLTLNEGKIAENMQAIQFANGLKPTDRKEIDKNNLDFTVEMETGTGKTYVYLRTIMELYRKYGFSKHIIVVPSIPIKEGVYKSLQITQEHLKQLYANVNYNFFIYDSNKLNQVRDFATSDGLDIMVINIQAFSKSFKDASDTKNKANIIHRYNDKLGYKPLDLIRNTNPVVFIDEPQKAMNTALSKKAVNNLNPIAKIRFSATHIDKINVMYKLDAVDAYNKKLVKQIEVASVQTEGANNMAYIRFVSVKVGKGKPTARLELDVFSKGKISRKTVTVKHNDDLEEITGREEYAGYIINDIYAQEGNEYIDFTSRDEIIRKGETIGNVDDLQIKRAMIQKTIEEHLNKELILNPQGIKVLSLFFIDSVAKYRLYDEEGKDSNGIYGQIFEEEYLKLIQKPKYQSLFNEITDNEQDASKVHNGYFSIDKKSKKSNKKEKYECYKDTTGSTNADEDTYNLIMRDKEKLLGFSSKLRFIFSHSALKEGWDNPNVFQVCTLKDGGKSTITKRQEIGRGLRLCVNQKGERIYGHEVNTLTVMASESYKDFVDGLQKEIESETGLKFGIIEEHSFGKIVINIDGDTVSHLGEQKSKDLHDFLQEKGYIDKRGKVQDLLRIDLKADKVDLPEEITDNPNVKKQVISYLKEVSGKLDIKNSDDKKKVTVNRAVLDSEEFRALWDKVKFKTTFSVDFDEDSLIQACITGLDEYLKVSRGKLHYSKASVDITEGGLIETETEKTTANLENGVEVLPDIVSYLQNETQLTRKAIVQILTGTRKLTLFKINPQKFIESCIDIINEQMKMHIIDGIQYKKIDDTEYYSQELFDNEELFGYLNSNLKESEKSPYEYVVYDSKTESILAEEFEKNSNISVYAKLPDWFKIDTPLGTYNPDWAILWKDDSEEKLFFVVESKGSTGLFDLRPKEQAKIACGKKHFAAIGSEMIVAANINDVEDFALSS
ncbi:type III restriction-modification system endonuclease [Marinifilum flexuosum]|uniref:Type III restriction enzyme n=1 Tax=Marinifilum flexuosum TaxID=1117708 RepID=A0A419X9M2_9BACT|nr:DEAD/DEAH box helicase family protein [Marinifilum flexuosum]RKE04463.1 type III restriction enzyme [Marinifilum flexuosum]